MNTSTYNHQSPLVTLSARFGRLTADDLKQYKKIRCALAYCFTSSYLDSYKASEEQSLDFLLKLHGLLLTFPRTPKSRYR